MSIDRVYRQQVELLLDILPFVRQETCFALKGGTAINLFVRDFPRLSIDIDLAYLPIEPRDMFLSNLTHVMLHLAETLEADRFMVIKKYIKRTQQISKLIISDGNLAIKVEPNMVLRGAVFNIEEHTLSQNAQDIFLQSQKVNTLSIADLYAGKICAALDRQHPRDLFDIKLLFENEGITNAIRQAFVIYLASSPRPMSELLAPRELDMRDAYKKEFLGMTDSVVSYEALHETRTRLIRTIQDALTVNERKFLVSIKQGKPNWALLPIPGIENLPGLKWKIINVCKMSESLRKQSLNKLKNVLEIH